MSAYVSLCEMRKFAREQRRGPYAMISLDIRLVVVEFNDVH